MKVLNKELQLEKMDKYQLSQLNREIVGDLEWINSHIKRVTEELEELKEQQETIQRLMKGEYNKTNAMIPLTNTLYVQGTIECNERIIISIGNNFYVSKKIEKALEIYERRIKEKTTEKKAYDILLVDRQKILQRMEIIIKRLVSIEQFVLNQK